MELLRNLVDNAALTARALADAPPDEVVAAHLRMCAADTERLLGTLLVEDRTLTATDRACPEIDEPLPVTVLNTSGAGGLTALAGRTTRRLRIAAVDTALRDPDDLAGNVARVASAARELDPDVVVHVHIPYGYGWEQAVAAAEAEELQGWLRPGGTDTERAEQLSGFVEADLPFVVDLDSPGQLINLLLALDALIEDAGVQDAAALVGSDDHEQQLASWDEARIGRVRRRLSAVRTADVPGLVDQLRRRGLLSGS